jgi:GR25 family glycosyltransferase involved in LPS biosynthesis
MILPKYSKETFQPDNNNEIEFYTITMKKPKRLENIERQLLKLKENSKTDIHFHIIDAVIGKELDLDSLIEQGILSREHKGNGGWGSDYHRGEIGCYMSHLKIYQIIQEKNKPGFSVIFEDDFDIGPNNLMEEIQKAIHILDSKKLDFDLLFLGTNGGNHGSVIENNLYSIDYNNVLYGTHAILINNQKIDKIIEKTKLINLPIDVKLTELTYSNQLDAYVIFPHIVNQQFDTLESTLSGFSFYKKMIYDMFTPYIE